jgi:type I restriction enzyme M protein
VVFNGSPLFTGGAGSGESDIRRWAIENDWLEAIIALPEQMFYNTGIGTFIWIVTNRKTKKRKGKIQLIDCRERYRTMPRSLGDKRRYIDQEIIDTLSREHGAFKESDTSKIFDNIHFGYRRITIERPLRLRFQITDDAKEMFLNSCPELFDAVEAIEETMGTEPHMDWNTAWPEILRIVKDCELGWDAGPNGTKQKKFFRDCFTETDPKAAPVIAKRGSFTGFVGKGKFPGQKLIGDLEPSVIDQIFGIFPETKGKKGKAVEYEADPKLRDNENVPLKEPIVPFFLREVRPFAADAWINADPKLRDEKDGDIGKVGYEINFNREFFSYEEPRSLKEIDKELAVVEKRILKMLQEVTE